MGFKSEGDTPERSNGFCVSGDQSVAILDLGSGNGHAIVLTGNASATHYNYYDPQSETDVLLHASELDDLSVFLQFFSIDSVEIIEPGIIIGLINQKTFHGCGLPNTARAINRYYF